ncbi:MAG: cyanophycin synthetase family protein, partial [Clostridia bacterium]
MKLLSYRYFEGPNVHCLRPVLESEVDLEDLAQVRTDAVPDLQRVLLERLPGLSGHHCGIGRPGGFVTRLRGGTYLGHVVEHVALELLAIAGEDVFYGKTRYQTPTVVLVVFEGESRAGSILALNEALRAVEELHRNPDWPWPDWHTLRDRLAVHRLGPSTRAIVAAARARDIPVARLDGDSLVRLGQGARQVRIRATMTAMTPAVAVDLAQDKMATKEVLAAAGLPVPDGRLVNTPAEACVAQSDWGVPVAVKPVAGNHGSGVRVNLQDPADIEEAFAAARQGGLPVLVERHLEGRGLRLLVVGSRMVAASERIPPSVVGDGVLTVEELIGRLNQDPRRGSGHAFPMSRVEVDAEVGAELRAQGLTLASVPERAQRVRLRRISNLSGGASSRDVTDEVGPDLQEDAVRAAQAVGLDVAGIDVVTP